MFGVAMRFLLSVLLLAATSVAANKILIGQSAPLSGGNADLGMDIRNATLAYFKKTNDAGGVNGRKIKLLTLDDKNEAKLSGENTRKLVLEENVVALFGYASRR
jgi:ABC-type branched-subunit amino acid transport system substrate-binding protein